MVKRLSNQDVAIVGDAPQEKEIRSKAKKRAVLMDVMSALKKRLARFHHGGGGVHGRKQ